jgi:hypothetical protein
MKPADVLRALALKIDQDADIVTDDDYRILVAASKTLVCAEAAKLILPTFVFDGTVQTAFLMRAVHRILPELEMNEEEKKAIAMLEEVTQ